MELYQLRTFVAVAEEGHLTRAADRLHISQPAVSAHIRALEEELAVMLFTRTPKGMTLTSAGETLRAQAMQVLASADDLGRQARMLARSVTGVIRLAVHIDPLFVQLPALIATLQTEFPDIRCELRQGMSWEIAREIRNETVDCGFLYGPVDQPEISTLHLQDFQLRVVGPPAWKERLERAGWPEIAAMPWVWPPDHCQFSRIAGEVFIEKGLRPEPAVIADQEAVLSALVSSGVGLSVMIEAEAAEAERTGKVTLWTEPVGVVPLYFACLARRSNDPLLQAALQCIARVWAQAA